MAATADTLYMTMSPGLDALKSSPLSASSESLQLGDYLDLSSMGSPMMPAAATPSLTKQQPVPVAVQAPPPTRLPPATAAPSVPSSSRTSATPASTSATSSVRPAQASEPTPPPPGSPPENIFRYYLKLELRKMGSPADDSIIDKYVQQHYGTFLKAMENGKGGSATPSTSTSRSSAKQSSASSAATTDKKPRVASTASPAPVSETLSSVSPQPQPQPFKVAMARAPSGNVNHDADDDMSFDNFAIKTEPTEHPLFSHIDPQYMQLGHGVPASDLTAKALREQDHQFASASTSTAPPPLQRRASDAMSEDDKDAGAEEDHDELAPLVSTMRFGASDRNTFAGSSDSGSCRGGSEEPAGVPGSIRDSAAANLRPTAEEYRALSSKEKRQLRNKISARNFRERRKEYITHLEGEIADRDAIISSLRQQMSNMSVHTKKLEEEVKTLQARQLSSSDVAKILEALGQAAGMPLSSQEQPQQQTQPALSALRPSAAADISLSAAGTAGILSSRPSTPSSPRPPFMRRASPGLPQHNPRKDISASGTSASSKSGSFWGSGPTVAASA